MITVHTARQLENALRISQDIVLGDSINYQQPLEITNPCRISGVPGLTTLSAPQTIPRAPDITLRDLTLKSDIVLTRDAQRLTIDNTLLLPQQSHGIQLSGVPDAPPLEDFAFLNSRILDAPKSGIYMIWEIVRPRIEHFTFIAREGIQPVQDEVYNGIWLGLGVVDGIISHGIIQGFIRNGLELFYPHAMVGGPAPSQTTLANPFGPNLQVSHLNISGTGHMGASFAGCKRSQISHITVRDGVGFGIEFVDEDPEPSEFAASHIHIHKIKGVGLNIEQIKGGRITGLNVSEIDLTAQYPFGVQVYRSQNVSILDSSFCNAGTRHVFSNQSTGTIVRGCRFSDDIPGHYALSHYPDAAMR